MSDLQKKYASKIAALLRKAESTTPEEAEALTDKAQELMVRYSIEQGMLDQSREGEVEKIIEKTIDYSGLYGLALRDLGIAAARSQGCKILVGTGRGERKNGRGEVAKLYVIGYEGDVDRAIQLDASLQIQVQVAMRKWATDNVESWWDRATKTYARRDFIWGFRSGVTERLRRAKKATTEEVVEEIADADECAVSVASESVALMVRTREEKIDDWVDQTYGKLRSGRSRSYTTSGTGANRAGYQSGLVANTGHGGALKSRKGLKA